MRILVDTHVFLWINTAQPRLGQMDSYLRDPSTDLFLSAASSWEIAIKSGRGKLDLPEQAARYVPSRMSAIGMQGLPVEQAHALAVADLPDHHRDPFDRMLVAQAKVENLVVATADPVFRAYTDQIIMP